MMLLLLLMPLAFWVQKSVMGDDSELRCDADVVLKQLRAMTSDSRLQTNSMDVIRDIQSVGFDPQIGHRICMARVGDGANARHLKFAISHTDSLPHTLRVEAVGD
jgi:hypothetical protein